MSIRLGELCTWGNITGTPGTDYIVFSGSGAMSDVRSAWPQRYTPRYTNPLVMSEGLFPIDTAGLSTMPFSAAVEIVYDYVFVAPASYTDGQSFQYVADRMRYIDAFVKGTYTLDSVAGTSGMRGWLKVADEDPASSTRYKCKARFLEGPSFELVKGQPSELHITVTFGLISDFVVVT